MRLSVRNKIDTAYEIIMKYKIYTAYNFIIRFRIIHSYLNSTITITVLLVIQSSY